jgi:peptide/nickel transport system ATP-binding protein
VPEPSGSSLLEVSPARRAGPLLEVRQLSVAYASDAGPVVAVDEVDLRLESGEFLAIVGESGCGKSTLLFAIAQLLSPPAGITGGSITFRGEEMVDMTERQLRHIRWRNLSVVMQSAMNALNPVMTVAEQMRDACRAHSEMGDEEIKQRSAEVLRLVSIDPVHLDSYPHQLSGGMRQRAMIAMALLFTPDLVIMDEPTSALDVVAQRSLMRQIKELQQELGFAVIFVTHDVSLIRQFSDRLMVMYAGQLAELGTTAEVFDTPRHPYSRGLLEAFPSIRGPRLRLTGIAGAPPDLSSPPSGCRFHPRCGDAMARCSTVDPPLFNEGGVLVRCLLYEAPVEGRVSLAGARTPGAATTEIITGEPADVGQPILEAEKLSRHFTIGSYFSRKKLHAVDDVSFAVNRREIVAVVGESGSGKSTVVRLLAMVYKATSGEVRFEAKALSDIKGRKAKLAYRGEVPMVFQDPYSSINPAFKISHGIMRAMKLHRRDLDADGRRAEAHRVMEAVGLTPAASMLTKYPYELSGGQRQRVSFAQALALRPKLILADEPVSMLDVSIRVGLLNLMAKLREQEGVSFIYVTHDLASARYVADRVIVMYAGHIVEQGPAEQLLSAPEHPYTKLLLASAPDPRFPADLEAPTDAGEPPKVVDPKPGCRFEPRCPYAIEICRIETPPLEEVAPDQRAACHVAIAEARKKKSIS